MTWTAVQEARAISDDASQSEGFAQAAVDLTKLDGAVFDEMVWRAVDSFAASVGVGPEQIEAFIGAEFRPRSEAAFVRTDQILAATGNIEVADAIAAARATDLDMRAVFDVYRAISESIEASLGSVFDELGSAANYGTAGLLQAAAQNLQLAIDTRDAIAQQFHGYFASSFDIGDAPAVELARL
ncbi:MAG TPA: hypothetical protein VLN74_01735, partial [Ilumatobacteraceae bacterium]|nr:hypothetical protein [Ilumatobacteraceae bacterium]